MQVFSIQFTLITDGKEKVTEAAVKRWVNSHLKKNDLGEVTGDVTEWSDQSVQRFQERRAEGKK